MGRRRTDEDVMNSEYVSISELVRLTGIRYSTIKYYTEEGLIPFEQEDERLTRRYPRVLACGRLEKIKALKENGLTITDIKSRFNS